jgi:hypothetical protein
VVLRLVGSQPSCDASAQDEVPWLDRTLAGDVNVRQRTRLCKVINNETDRLGHKVEESWLSYRQIGGPFARRAPERARSALDGASDTHQAIRATR